MPYITQKQRNELLSEAPEYDRAPENCGELNFLITSIIHNYIEDKGLCYSTLNEVIGVLECAKMELYRTIVSPYEDKKRLENGPISDLDSKTLEGVDEII